MAGVLIAAVGCGWVFMLNALSFVAVLGAWHCCGPREFHPRVASSGKRRGIADGMRHVWGRPDLRAVLIMFFLIGTFGINFPIYISTMSVSVFHVGAGQFGLLTSSMAVGSVTGALMAAGREKPRMELLLAGRLAFGTFLLIAAGMPAIACSPPRCSSWAWRRRLSPRRRTAPLSCGATRRCAGA